MPPRRACVTLAGMRRVGFLGAWSIGNPGDVLLAQAVREALAARLPGVEIVGFAPRFPTSGWRHDFHRLIAVPAHADMSWVRGYDLDALVIGGGGVVSLHPWFRPFLLGEPARWSGPPAAWNGVCSQSTNAADLSDRERDLVRSACERLVYVSVRNRSTARFLTACGWTDPTHVVPDVAFAADLPASGLPDSPRVPGLPDLDAGRFLIGYSPGAAAVDPRFAPFFASLHAGLLRLADERGGAIVLFPFGGVYGDDARLEAVAASLPGARVVTTPLSAAGRLAVVGRMSFYVGARLHAIVAALRQDVPFLAVDEYLSIALGTSKIRELLVDPPAGLERRWSSPAIDLEIDWSATLAEIATPTVSFAPLVAGWRRALDAHHDALVQALVR